MVSSDERTGSIYVNRFPYLLINFQYSTESNLRPNDCAGRVGRLEKPPKRQFLEFATSDGIHLVVQLTTVPTTQFPSLQRLPVARYGASTVHQFTAPFWSPFLNTTSWRFETWCKRSSKEFRVFRHPPRRRKYATTPPNRVLPISMKAAPFDSGHQLPVGL